MCLSGAKTPTPTDGTHGYICPTGMYCPDGIRNISCGIGYYNPSFGASFKSDCQICPLGTSCPF